MPKDALTIYRSARELEFLVGGKVDKVNMPDHETMILLVHTRTHGNHRLLLSCNPSLPRVHITTRKYENPDTASGTLMYFRKRLCGATITGVTPDRTERMISFELVALDELAERVEYKLIAELTGKCANIVFCENGKISNPLRKVTSEAPGKRAVLAGLPYALPNPTGRVGVFDGEALSTAVTSISGVSTRAAVNKCVSGLAQTTVDELFYRLGIADGDEPNAADVDRFADAARTLYASPLDPVVTFDGDKPLDFFVEPYKTCYGRAVHYKTLNEAMDAYYSALFEQADFAAYMKPIKAAVKSAVSKNKKRRADAQAKLTEAAGADADRIVGELITSAIYKIKRGDTSVTVENWYDDGKPVTIALDVTKTPSQNAAAHFKAYNKKKKAAVYAKAALDAARDAMFTLDAISTELELCTEKRELDEVRDELVSLGLMKPQNKRVKQKPAPSEPYKFDVLGATLLVGKNHAQNDRITRGAAKTDIWLHVKDAHGCHAVLKAPHPTDEQITRAAELAAYYSIARASENVAVDYTQIKYVFPHGGGHVDYKEYKTVFVTPKKYIDG